MSFVQYFRRANRCVSESYIEGETVLGEKTYLALHCNVQAISIRI